MDSVLLWSEIATSFHQLQDLQEEFKGLHKEVETNRSSSIFIFSLSIHLTHLASAINKLKQDIQGMEDEKKQVQLKIEKLSRKVENLVCYW